MARPFKPIALSTGNISNEEKAKRLKEETRLQGDKNQVNKVPKWLTKEGRKKYKWFVKELEVTGVLCNLDIDALAQYCNALADYERYDLMKQTVTDIDDLEKIERLQDKANKKVKEGKVAFGLDPSSRAKIAGMNIQKQQEEESPLAKILKGRK